MGLLDLIRRGRYVADTVPTAATRQGRSMSLAQAASKIAAGDEPLDTVRDSTKWTKDQ